jgi:DNA-directed RNA polymerase specialized sigma24 family protein
MTHREGDAMRDGAEKLVLRLFYDLPFDAVAVTLGCSTGTVKSHTSRGLSTMRRLLGGLELAATN